MSGIYPQKDSSLLVFTDLDGTLLDHHTYSFEPALPALNSLKEKNIPLIICTSKTRAEIPLSLKMAAPSSFLRDTSRTNFALREKKTFTSSSNSALPMPSSEKS
jgi:HAD superfamily hydrolase (TIGR01484 family)